MGGVESEYSFLAGGKWVGFMTAVVRIEPKRYILRLYDQVSL